MDFRAFIQKLAKSKRRGLSLNLRGVMLFGVLLFGALLGKAQQCTLPSRIFLPEADISKFEQLGMSMDVDGDYMVAGIHENCEMQVYSGKVLIYKIDAEDKWVKIAEIVPSDPGKYRNFGQRVAISGNTIVVSATEYNDAGTSKQKLYVYEKLPTAEWTSGTESYVIAKEFGLITNYSGHSIFNLNSTELVTFAAELGDWKMEVYKKTGGVFSLAQSIDLPLNPYGSDYQWNLAVADDMIAIGTEQFEHGDRTNGVVFVYEKLAGTYKTTPAKLRASEQLPNVWQLFGNSVAAHNNTIIVRALRYDNNGNYAQTFYAFEKPAGGWVDESKSAILESKDYIYYNSQLIVNENYIMATGENYEGVVGFKKSGSQWNSSAIPIRINVDTQEAEASLIGYQIGMSDKHLVIGCPARFRLTGASDEYIADYFSATGSWEGALTQNQRIRYTSVNATDDFFGKAFGVYGDQIAISASGDDKKGSNSGVVYVFNSNDQSNTPRDKIYNPEDENHSGFGNRLAMGDSVMFITAPFKDSLDIDGKAVFYSIGKVYVYRLRADGWKYSSQIIAPNIYSQVTFGQNVVWSPGYCAVTEFYGGSSESVGRVHIFKENKVNEKFEYIATLDPEEHLRSDFFGNSMVMTDSMMVIGTGAGAPNSSYRQSAYVFYKKGEWTSTTEDARLRASDSGWLDRFGASVSISGEYIVVGAPYSPGFDPRPVPRNYVISGAAYIFKRPQGGWKGVLTETAKITPSDPTEFGTFGTTVVIDHKDIFIGSPNVYAQYNYSDKLSNTYNRLIPGKVYHYVMPPEGWATTDRENRQIHSFEPEIVDGYGASMYVSDRYLYVGVMLDDTEKGFRTGSVQTMMQLPAIDAPPAICIDQDPLKLHGFPKGGQWAGPGVSASGTFSPSVAGPGDHIISYFHSGCESTTVIRVLASRMIILNQSPPEQTKCIGQEIQLSFESTESAENYAWYYRQMPDQPLIKIDSMKQTIDAVKPGFYEVIVSRGECPARREIFQVMDDAKIEINIESVPLICSSNSVQLVATPTAGRWTGPGVSSNGVFQPDGLANDDFDLHYLVLTPVGCLWKDSITVKVDLLRQPELQYNGKTICGNHPVELRVGNTDQSTAIQWYRDELVLNEVGQSITTTIGGDYKVLATKGACTLETDTRHVAKEDIQIEFQQSMICSDELVNLTAIPDGGTWEGTAVSPEGEFNPIGLSNGAYPQAYTLNTQLGCTWRKVLDLQVDKLELPVISTDLSEICLSRPAALKVDKVDNRSTLVWYNNGNLIADAYDRALITNKPGSYYADVSKSTCSRRTAVIELWAEADSLFVPNVFTANGDHFNDQFEIRVDGIEDMQLKLFNRNGQTLFETTDPAFTWKAPDVPSGIYFWHMVYRTCSNTRKEEKGWVHVIK